MLVVLSYIIAALGSFSGLRLATNIQNARTKKSKTMMHIGSAFTFGAGIWSMHFIGMLAYDMEMVHTYDPALTILSMAIAVIVAYGVLQIIRTRNFKISKLVLSASLLGLAICGMHYVGMAAMKMDATLLYIPSLFALSILIAITASGAAVAKYYTEKFLQCLGKPDALVATKKDPIKVYIKAFKGALTEDKRMCLCGLLGAEIDGLPPEVAAQTKAFFEQNIDWLTQAYTLKNGKAGAKDKATQTLALLEGAMITSNVLNDAKSFDAAVNILFS